ncbi:hypothetical protein BLNAU_16750 [Blattamonas nauphoetae]|uniref:Uncharacterized protein n=1 Tax=Blattamonas nauphoetae TaxID=2049346 RepID=A0ABQ9X8Q8_9EUKA|nr:hypothetical protein BLNAU_16750 [Blattamonas nauphoetae]
MFLFFIISVLSGLSSAKEFYDFMLTQLEKDELLNPGNGGCRTESGHLFVPILIGHKTEHRKTPIRRRNK